MSAPGPNPRLDDAVAAAARDDSPDGIALMRILGEAASEEEARGALERAYDRAEGATRQRVAHLRAVWATQPQAWAVVRATLAGAAHDAAGLSPDATLAYWADAFSRLVAASPEASVALYSLGNTALLDAATADVVALLDRLGVLGPDRDGLDVGCGIGRFLRALAPRLRGVTGLDISPGMVAEAERRCAGLLNVKVALTSGRDLQGVPDRSVDLILAADVFPYLVQAGGDLAERHIAAFGRALRPGGAALILNYSYRGDVGRDTAEIEAAAVATGLHLHHLRHTGLVHWDAAAFLLRRPA